MTETKGSKYVPGYDLFKLIVAVILTIILIALLLRVRSPASVTVTVVSSTAEVSLATLPSQPSATSLLPTATPQSVASSTPTQPPTPTETPQPVASSTPTPTPPAAPAEIPATPVITPPAAELGSGANECPSFPSRIHVGDSVRVLLRLNFRTNPGLNSPIILTNNPGIQMEVIGGPVCTTKNLEGGPRAYLWWNVRMQNGREGWSAEAPLITPFYFLEPIP